MYTLNIEVEFLMFIRIRIRFRTLVECLFHFEIQNSIKTSNKRCISIFVMEVLMETNVASRGWHVYGKTVWKNPCKGQKVVAKKEKNKEALDIDPYAIAWTLKKKNKLIPDVVGHVPREISRFVWFFITHGGKIEAHVLSVKPKSSPIPSGGLEIILRVKFSIDEKHANILKHLRQLIEENYELDIESNCSDGILDLQLEKDEDDGDDDDDDDVDVLFIDDDSDDIENEH